jgi:hypothetical protein
MTGYLDPNVKDKVMVVYPQENWSLLGIDITLQQVSDLDPPIIYLPTIYLSMPVCSAPYLRFNSSIVVM